MDLVRHSAPHARRELHALLCALFPGDHHELRDFARTDNMLAIVVESVAWTLSKDAVVHEFIMHCEARGLIDEGFFLGLVSVRRYRRAEIAAVARLWGIMHNWPSTYKPTMGPRRRSGGGLVARIGLVVTLVVLPTPEDLTVPVEPHHAEPTPSTPPAPPVLESMRGALSLQETGSREPRPADTAGRRLEGRPACKPPNYARMYERLRNAGSPGGVLHDCWLGFWMQSAISAADCPVRLSGLSIREATLSIIRPKQRTAETMCFSTRIPAVLRLLDWCPMPISREFSLIEIQPQTILDVDRR